MNSTDLYCTCNFPELPKNISVAVSLAVEQGLKHGNNIQFLSRPWSDTETQGFNSSRTFRINDSEYSRATYRRFTVSDNVVNWVHENIWPECGEISAQYIGDGQAFSPHTDGGPREYILNYVVDAGGDAVETQWWQENDHDLIRPGTPLQFPFTDNLTLVGSTIFKPRSWSALYSKVIHGVTNLTGKRVQLSIALSTKEFAKLKERYSLELKYYG
jgi:hypothetical protein